MNVERWSTLNLYLQRSLVVADVAAAKKPSLVIATVSCVQYRFNQDFFLK